MAGDGTLEQRLDMFYERKREVENQILKLQKTMQNIENKIQYYEAAVEENTGKSRKKSRKKTG
jgi:predicted  nucleic acid-binding Zn-ribbon protein